MCAHWCMDAINWRTLGEKRGCFLACLMGLTPAWGQARGMAKVFILLMKLRDVGTGVLVTLAAVAGAGEQQGKNLAIFACDFLSSYNGPWWPLQMSSCSSSSLRTMLPPTVSSRKFSLTFFVFSDFITSMLLKTSSLCCDKKGAD